MPSLTAPASSLVVIDITIDLMRAVVVASVARKFLKVLASAALLMIAQSTDSQASILSHVIPTELTAT
jgi:hypothetical protein